MVMQKSLLLELADKLTKEIYRKTFDFPFKFQSSLGDQLRRASLSIPLNITEGNSRKSDREEHQFLRIAFSSLKETKYLMYFAREFDLISEKTHLQLFDISETLAKLLYGILYKKV
jgi:four helix bundle protein